MLFKTIIDIYAIQFPPEIYAKDYLQTQNMVSIFVSDLDFV